MKIFSKLIIFISTLLLIFLNNCQGLRDNLSMKKKANTDEFLVQKKDPLILPPDYENLPSPGEGNLGLEEDSIFQDTLDTGEDSSTSTSIESSILKKIQSK